jgi:hypothetical protein
MERTDPAAARAESLHRLGFISLASSLADIFAKPTKYGAGIEIHGDYYDLENVHQTILDLAGRAPVNGGAEEFILGLAYEFRKAYEGSRGTLTMSYRSDDPIVYFTFKYYGLPS